ncbi:MAG: VPLPA-CTERM sorting domain-containing protein [Gammaproteobacteria bacterium]|nr:VPLPA-CTERM sorting domain-containing protein [Gammaproteobacteria bacterium]
MKIKHIITAATLMLATSAATASTIWAPTNMDTDFIQFDFAGNPNAGAGISTNGGILALFDDSDAGFANALIIGDAGGEVRFTDNNDGSWNAEVFDVTNASGGSITLSGDNSFSLGMNWGAGYVGDSNASLLSSPDTYLVVFDGMDVTGGRISGNTLAVDLAPVPVPAAAWLFGTGLLGIVGIARRRNIQ